MTNSSTASSPRTQATSGYVVLVRSEEAWYLPSGASIRVFGNRYPEQAALAQTHSTMVEANTAAASWLEQWAEDGDVASVYFYNQGDDSVTRPTSHTARQYEAETAAMAADPSSATSVAAADQAGTAELGAWLASSLGL